MPSEAGESPRSRALTSALNTAEYHRRRQDYEAAWRAVDDALLIAGDHPALFEMMGQLNLDAGQAAAAVQCYQRALALEPGRAAAEIGLGRASLALDESATGEQETTDPILKGRAPNEATLRSVLVPGLGQAYAGEPARGVAFLVPWLLLWGLLIWVLTSPGSLTGPAPGAARGAGAGVSPLLWLAALLLVVLHAAAGLDAGRVLRRAQGAGPCD